MFSYTTKVRIDIEGLKSELSALWDAYSAADPTGELRKTKKSDNMLGAEAARSSFSRVNNLQKFVDRLESGEIPSTIVGGDRVIEVVASAKGNSTRVYFKPSITSLTKEIRKHIKPLNDGNVFVFFDIKAAEFALRCIQAQEVEALTEYAKGGDIYMHFADIFPSGTERKVIKKCLIANMYNQTAYAVSKDLGITETQAQRLLDKVAMALPRQTMLKRKIVQMDLRMGGYFAPCGYDQTNLVKVADIDPVKGFNPDLAQSVYTQSALGFIMQQYTNDLIKKQNGREGTLLSVFDSVLMEIEKPNSARYEEWAKKKWSPLLPESFGYGSTFFEAAYGDSNL